MIHFTRSVAVVMHRRLQAIGLTIAVCTAAVSLPVLNAQPRFTSHPTSRMVVQGLSASFRTGGTGAAPLNYQWYFNGAAQADATNSVLSLRDAQRSMSGAYFAVVSDASGSATSRVARLDVYVRNGIFDIGDPDEFDKILSTEAVLTRMATLNS